MVYSPVNPWTFPVNPNFPWLPKTNTITSITQSNPAVITTGTNHGYSSGFNIRIVFPFPNAYQFGMTQINEQIGTITVLSPNSFAIDINSLNYDPFVLGSTTEVPQVIPVGQYTNINLDDSTQVNPPNPQDGQPIPIFQSPGLQAAGPCSTSQT